jgi:acyl-CoA-binding protein
MTMWVELVERNRPAGLPAAERQELATGQHRFAFIHGDDAISDPSHDPAGELFVSPREYGFSIRGFQGGNTAWARDFANGTMLLTSADGQSHVLSPRFPARIVFLALDGSVLQDSGGERRAARPSSEYVTVRLTVNATVDLNGMSAESARAQLVGLLDDALTQWGKSGQTNVALVEHAIEQVVVSPDRRTPSSDTDFSQLLDL